MTPREHLEQIVKPDLQDLSANPSDIRHAFNAIAAVDALAAHIYCWAQENRPPDHSVAKFKRDSDYRYHLATLNVFYRLTFQAAKASKHIILSDNKASLLVSRADQVAVSPPAWDGSRWDDARSDVAQTVITPTGETEWSVEGVLKGALEFLEEQMRELGIP